MKAATRCGGRVLRLCRISIHAAREGGDALDSLYRKGYLISIHAAREGGDFCLLFDSVQVRLISIHAAREGGDCNVK